MMELISDPQAWVTLAVLSGMEIVLGIDNIVFITILTGKLPPEEQLLGRRLGLGLALISRLALLFAITWVMKLTQPLFTLVVEWSGKDLILMGGGLFLLYKATHEIYENVERPHDHQPEDVGDEMAEAQTAKHRKNALVGIIIQIIILDIVFSLDSVITAVGMANQVPIMVAAMIIAVGVMLIFAGPIGDFVQKHPSIRVLALAFLILIAVMLIMESTGAHVSKGYIYAAMGFSLLVEMLNMRLRSRRQKAMAALREARDSPG